MTMTLARLLQPLAEFYLLLRLGPMSERWLRDQERRAGVDH